MRSQPFAAARETLAAFPGKTPVYFKFQDTGKTVLAPKDLWLDVSRPVLDRLTGLLGEGHVVYRE